MTEPGDGRPRCDWATSAPEYVAYHDDEWGRPVTDDTRIFEKLCRTLRIGGYLFLGSVESTLNLTDNFREVALGKSIFYQRIK